MESSFAESNEIGPPSNADIADHLERATRSVLASSSLASYSYSPSSAREKLSQLPTLSDLLTHIGAPDGPRCPSCRASLPFGPRSTLCLACDATIVEVQPPSLSSSLAFRRFSEALGLETEIGVAEEDHFPDHEGDLTSKSSLALVEPGADKGLLKVEDSIERQSAHVDVKITEASVSTPLAHTSTANDFTLVTPSNSLHPAQESSSILDYSAKLEGISLEDFFSNQAKQESSTPPISESSLIDVSETIMPTGTPRARVQKDTLFWNPLSETIIPDGFDMLASTRELSSTNDIASDKVTVMEEDDDPFDSWEGDFQSAPPAVTGTSASFHSSKSESFIQSRELEDFFGAFSSTVEKDSGESSEFHRNNGWANDVDFFGSSAHTSVGRNADADDLLFGSEWQQSMPLASATPPTNNCESTNFFNAIDVVGSLSPVQREISGINESSFYPSQERNSTVAEGSPPTDLQESQSAGKKNKIVGSLLSRLHDLSFMLTDKLVIKVEGKGKDSKSSSSS